MDLAEKYAYEVYKNRSFSKAAKLLFISQSSLSITIKKLENKLGFLIFDRSKSPIALSREGAIYIEYLEEIMHNENDMYSRINRISHPLYNQLSIGNAYFVSRYLLPSVCKEFQQKFPDVELKLYMGEANSYSSLFDKLDSGILQLVIGFRFDKKKYTGIPILSEKYVICIKNDYPGIDALKKYELTREEVLSGKDFPDKTISNFGLFSNIEFLKINSAGIIWHDMANFLMHCPVAHCQIYDCRNIDIIYNMMLCGMGATITTDSVIAYNPPRNDVLYFLIDTQTPTRQSFIIYNKDAVLSKSAEAFIEIITKTAPTLKTEQMLLCK